MPNTKRGDYRQKIDGAIGNIEWCLDKIAYLGTEFTESNKYYTENNLELPELNKALLMGLEIATEQCDNLITVLKQIRDSL